MRALTGQINPLHGTDFMKECHFVPTQVRGESQCRSRYSMTWKGGVSRSLDLDLERGWALREPCAWLDEAPSDRPWSVVCADA